MRIVFKLITHFLLLMRANRLRIEPVEDKWGICLAARDRNTSSKIIGYHYASPSAPYIAIIPPFIVCDKKDNISKCPRSVASKGHWRGRFPVWWTDQIFLTQPSSHPLIVLFPFFVFLSHPSSYVLNYPSCLKISFHSFSRSLYTSHHFYLNKIKINEIREYSYF